MTRRQSGRGVPSMVTVVRSPRPLFSSCRNLSPGQRDRLRQIIPEWSQINVDLLAERMALPAEAIVAACRTARVPIVARAGSLWISGGQPRQPQRHSDKDGTPSRAR
jgi:hypothetical protein